MTTTTASVLKAGTVKMVYLHERAAETAREAADTRHRVEVEAAYQAGMADGRRAAEAAGLAAMPGVATAIDRAVAGLGDEIARQAGDDATTLVAFAAEIARWILGRELETDPGAVVGRIEAALGGLSPNGRLVVRVSPESADYVKRWAEGRDADIVPDPTLTPGEARLTAGDAGADLTWAQAFNRVREAFADTADQAELPRPVSIGCSPADDADDADDAAPEWAA